MIKINNPKTISLSEKQKILSAFSDHNFAIYDMGQSTNLSDAKNLMKSLGKTFGLTSLDNNLCADEDNITTLAVSEDLKKQHYIPYSNQKISWHTDGYYNPLKQMIGSFILHCVMPAPVGGANKIIDYRRIYKAIMQHDSDYIKILSMPDVMTIPANIVDGVTIRPERSTAVFIKKNGVLRMRYTARKNNIIWSNKAILAVKYLNKLLNDEQFCQKIKLKSGQGIIANNTLHTRDEFKDTGTQKRVVLRARYYKTIENEAFKAS